jgi:peptidyl-prolyl cis-trans isomerase D
MKSKLLFFSAIVLLLASCTQTEKKDFEPFTLNNISEDSLVVTITYDEFNTSFQNSLRYQKILNKGKLSQEQQEELYSQTFANLVNTKKLLHETNYLGLQITQAEENDFLYGNNIDEKISSMPIFKNPQTKEFDKSLVKPFTERLSKDKQAEPYFVWQQHINDIKKEKLREKYESLLHASYINTKTLDNWHNKLSVGESTLKIFTVAYNKYYDSIDPTEQDYLEFIQNKSYDYQVSDKRYIRVANIPARIHKHFHEKEYNVLKRYIETIKDFNNIATQNDFIKTFSSYYNEKTLPENLVGFFKNGKQGDVYGPYFENNSYRALRINSISDIPTEAKAQHLVINNISKEIILETKKEIIQKMGQGSSFIDLAKEYAEKHGMDGKWGDLDWFTYGEMVDDFSDSVFLNQPGDIVLSKSQYGWHIINIIDHKNISKKYSFTALYWPLQPVEEDLESTMVAAREFIGKLDNHTEFESKASEKGYPIEEYEAFAQGKRFVDFDNSYEVFKWAYNAFENDIKTFRIDDKIYVVKLYKIAAPGLMPVFDARQYVRNGVFNEKVKAYLNEHLNIDKINSMPIDEAAQYMGETLYVIQDIKFTDISAPRVGTDPFIVGLMTAFEEKERSGVIFGNQRIAVFEKISETNKQLTTQVGNNKLKEWNTNVSNGRYKYAFKRNDNLVTNIARQQDSYFLVPNYKNNLTDDKALAEAMFLAEKAFKNKDYKNALYGTKQYKGFASLIDNSTKSKQQRLLLLYAGLSALQIGEYEKVITYLDQFETEDRFFSIVKYGAQGDAYSQMGDDKKALELYLKADAANDNFVIGTEYVIRSAAIYDAMGKYEKALEQYRLLRTKHAPTRHNFETDKYLGYYEYLVNKEKYVLTK